VRDLLRLDGSVERLDRGTQASAERRTQTCSERAGDPPAAAGEALRLPAASSTSSSLAAVTGEGVRAADDMPRRGRLFAIASVAAAAG
jgi:hypothetical protein